MQDSRFWFSPYDKDIALFKACFSSFEFSKHWHDELAIGVIQRGAEGLVMSGASLVVPAGQIIVINPGEIHTGYGVDCDIWMYRMLYFDAHFVCCIADKLGVSYREFPYIGQSLVNDPRLFKLLLQLHYASEQLGSKLAYETLLIRIFRRLFRYHDQRAAVDRGRVIPSDSQAVISLKDYIDQYWYDNISLKELSELSGLSQYQVIRHFEKQYAISPHQYLIQKKLVEAKKRIVAGQALSVVSADCGFYDQSHMIRNFKKTFAMTPSSLQYIN